VTRFLRPWLCFPALLLAGACSSTPADSDHSSGGEAAGGDAGSGAGASGGGPQLESCPPGTNPKSDPKPTELGLVTGQIVDEQGEPTSAGIVQVCGRDVCINARVGSNGKLAEDVKQALDAPACKWGDGLTWGKLAVPLEAGDTELGTLTAVRLPDFADAAPFEPGSSVTSNGVTLTLDKTARVEVDTLSYEDETQRGFRAAALPPAALALQQPELAAAYVLSPLETRICPSPALRVENSPGLAPGAALELYVLGLSVEEAWAPYGHWQLVGEGQVSDDGTSLDFPEGLPLLTAIGIREKR
jgi:hypothetical protein